MIRFGVIGIYGICLVSRGVLCGLYLSDKNTQKCTACQTITCQEKECINDVLTANG